MQGPFAFYGRLVMIWSIPLPPVFLPGNRVVFNVGGNKYRLVAAVAYQFGAVYIKFIGTHADYDKIDAANVDQSS